MLLERSFSASAIESGKGLKDLVQLLTDLRLYHWLFWSALRCEGAVFTKIKHLKSKSNSSAGCSYTRYTMRPPVECVTEGGQSKCRVERSHALEQARRPQESMFVPECNEDGTFAQVCLCLSLNHSPPLSSLTSTNLCKLRVSYLSACAGPVPYSDRLLLVCDQ